MVYEDAAPNSGDKSSGKIDNIEMFEYYHIIKIYVSRNVKCPRGSFGYSLRRCPCAALTWFDRLIVVGAITLDVSHLPQLMSLKLK